MPELPPVPPTTEAVLRASRVRRIPGHFAVARCRAVGEPERHLMVSRDELETTVITRPERLAGCEVLELNPDRWALLAVDCASPFYCVGFFARLAAALAAAGIDLLALSTFSRDLLLVKEDDAERALAALRATGLGAEAEEPGSDATSDSRPAWQGTSSPLASVEVRGETPLTSRGVVLSATKDLGGG